MTDLASVWSALGGDPALLSRVSAVERPGVLDARLPVRRSARACVGACALAAAELGTRRAARTPSGRAPAGRPGVFGTPAVRVDDGAVAAASAHAPTQARASSRTGSRAGRTSGRSTVDTRVRRAGSPPSEDHTAARPTGDSVSVMGALCRTGGPRGVSRSSHSGTRRRPAHDPPGGTPGHRKGRADRPALPSHRSRGTAARYCYCYCHCTATASPTASPRPARRRCRSRRSR